MYIRDYDLTNPEIAKGIDSPWFPEHRMAVVHGEHSIRLWVESFVPIDAGGVPVGQPLRQVVPVALQTTSDLYLFALQLDYVGEAQWVGGTVEGFDGRVFDLSKCDKVRECYDTVSRALRAQLAGAFGAPPLQANPTHRRAPPYQLRFERRFEESIVLKGLAGPYYELTTYTITIWPGPRSGPTGDNESYMDGNLDDSGALFRRDQVFLQVTMALQIGVGRKGDYPEPSAEQYGAYQKAVAAAVRSAVKGTVAVVGYAHMEGDVGVMGANSKKGGGIK